MISICMNDRQYVITDKNLKKIQCGTIFIKALQCL